MSKLLDDVIARVRGLPEDEQDRAAETLLVSLEQGSSPDRLTPDQAADVARRLGALEEGRTRILSDEETEEMWDRLTA